MIGSYMVDPVTLHKVATSGGWGEPGAVTDLSVNAYVEFKTQMVRNIAGEQVASMITLYLNKVDIDEALGRALLHRDRFTISGDDFDRSIIAIGQPKAFSDPHYRVNLK